MSTLKHDEEVNRMEVVTEEVAITVRMNKAFVEAVEKYPIFKTYHGLEDFARDAMMKLKEDWDRKWQS